LRGATILPLPFAADFAISAKGIAGGFLHMADHASNEPAELGAKMDYQEHESTYDLFLNITKYVTLIVVALLIAMAFGFFTTAGFFSATILFVLICAVGAYFLR
jgi:hypothetical protein